MRVERKRGRGERGRIGRRKGKIRVGQVSKGRN